MSNGVVEKSKVSTEIVTALEGPGDFLPIDLEPAQIILMQKQSKLVQSDDAIEKEFRTIEGELIADAETPMRAVVLHASRFWDTYELVQVGKTEQKSFVSAEKVGAHNMEKQFKELIDGTWFLKSLRYRLYILPIIDGELALMPYKLSTKFQASKSAKALLTQRAMAAAGKSPAHVLFDFCVVAEKNDKGSWWKWVPKVAGTAEESDRAAIDFWHSVVAKIDERTVATDPDEEVVVTEGDSEEVF